MTVMTYDAFLATKLALPQPTGVGVPLDSISPVLYPFQRQLVQWALRKGRVALFADTGLGKTLMQLEWARFIRMKARRVLIVAPLAVAIQTVTEARKLGLDVLYARSQSDVETGPADNWHTIVTTNYEMVDRFDPAEFGAVVLDESSILKSVDGKTKDKLIEMFRSTPYRLCCSATPAPNDIAEFSASVPARRCCPPSSFTTMKGGV